MESIKRFNQRLALVFWVVGIVGLCAKADPFIAGIVFLPFAFGPQILTHLAIALAKSKAAQVTSLVALVAYFGLFCFVYADVFFVNSDPQGAVALLFLGVYATPVMLVLWLLVAFFEHRHRKAHAPGNV